jgi:hypothetical protein
MDLALVKYNQLGQNDAWQSKSSKEKKLMALATQLK